ncbi:uncharacterized protein JCM10292_002165 [Rhodotorula paludigena]|uniref:uncharacterized protein n=1 Tax=Rhodotorula paludigena TaxID=86838 RepID=UPI00317534B7
MPVSLLALYSSCFMLMLLCGAYGVTNPAALSAAHSASLLSLSHRNRSDDTSSTSGDDSSSNDDEKGAGEGSSSGEEDEKPKRWPRQKQDFKVSPVVVVLAIALVVAVALAVYFGTRALSSPQAATPSSGGSTDTSAGAAEASQALTTSAPIGTSSKGHGGGTSQTSGDSRPAQSRDDHQHDDDGDQDGDDEDDGEGGSATNATATQPSDGEPTKTSAGGVPEATQPSGSKSTLVDQCLSEHNSFRTTHHADPLTWDDTLAKAAEDWSAKCVWEHSGGKYGENLFMTAGSDMTETSTYDASLGVKSWNDEEKMYDYNNPGFAHDTGHFTQTVWKDTQRVGCHLRMCQGMMDGYPWTAYLVCEYDPPGNFADRFRDNVLPP